MSTKVKATVEDLYDVPENGKAEIINGEIVLMSPTGARPGYAADEVFVSLRAYARSRKIGRAVGDNKAFRVNLPNRESFSPDAAFYLGPSPGMKFYEGAPVFAVEVRSEYDYGRVAEQNLAEKRADYFAAGTLVVWDVNLLSDIKSYSAYNPHEPAIFHRGDLANAEPALPYWEFPVDDLFEKD